MSKNVAKAAKRKEALRQKKAKQGFVRLPPSENQYSVQFDINNRLMALDRNFLTERDKEYLKAEIELNREMLLHFETANRTWANMYISYIVIAKEAVKFLRKEIPYYTPEEQIKLNNFLNKSMEIYDKYSDLLVKRIWDNAKFWYEREIRHAEKYLDESGEVLDGHKLEKKINPFQLVINTDCNMIDISKKINEGFLELVSLLDVGTYYELCDLARRKMDIVGSEGPYGKYYHLHLACPQLQSQGLVEKHNVEIVRHHELVVKKKFVIDKFFGKKKPKY